MPSDIVVRELGPRTIAYLREHGSARRIPVAIGELIAWIDDRGLAVAGPVGARWFRERRGSADEDADWEVFAELASTVDAPTSDGTLGVRKLPLVSVASLTHRGPYDTLGTGYDRLLAWTSDHDHLVAGPAEEVYLSAPDVPPEQTLTEVRIPIARPR